MTLMNPLHSRDPELICCAMDRCCARLVGDLLLLEGAKARRHYLTVNMLIDDIARHDDWLDRLRAHLAQIGYGYEPHPAVTLPDDLDDLAS